MLVTDATELSSNLIGFTITVTLIPDSLTKMYSSDPHLGIVLPSKMTSPGQLSLPGGSYARGSVAWEALTGKSHKGTVGLELESLFELE